MCQHGYLKSPWHLLTDLGRLEELPYRLRHRDCKKVVYFLLCLPKYLPFIWDACVNLRQLGFCNPYHYYRYVNRSLGRRDNWSRKNICNKTHYLIDNLKGENIFSAVIIKHLVAQGRPCNCFLFII